VAATMVPLRRDVRAMFGIKREISGELDFAADLSQIPPSICFVCTYTV
jgi:hypothetical protein